MSRRISGALAVPVVLVILLIPALSVLLRGDALPCTHDNIFHGYRIVAMREMLRFGWLFSRWVPNLALGYGYPFFNYREPLPYLVGEAGLALGVPLPLVLGALYAISLVAAGWGAYVLGRDLFGERAGWVAGVTYALAPYMMLDALRRGNMPESIGLALVPWLFVVTRRLILTRSRRSLLAVVVLLTALFLSHNISGLLLAPFLGAYVLLLSWRHRARGSWSYAFLAVGIAVLLTAWFWLPALAEQGMVQLHLSRSTRNNDFHYNFAAWRELLFSVPPPHDPDYLNPPMRVSLGVVQAALGAAGIVLGLGRRRRPGTRGLVGLLAAAGAFYLWMATPGSVGLWDAVPLLAFVQFPWRLAGRALLPACLLAGVAVEVLAERLPCAGSGGHLGTAASGTVAKPGRRPTNTVRGAASLQQRWLVVLVVVATAVLAWPTMVPPKGLCPAEPYPDLGDLYAREREGWIGMDPENSYFPIWVEEHPTDMVLADAFIAGELPARMDPSSLPPGAKVVDAAYRPVRARITVTSPAPFTGRWLGLYYPGWQVRIDGKRVAVTPEDDTGLMLFAVPAGDHEISVRLGMTWPRAVGTGIAVLGLAVLAATLRFLSLPGSEQRAALPPASVSPNRRRSPTFALIGAAVFLTSVRYGLVGRLPTPAQRSRVPDGQLPEVTTPLNQPFDDGMVLLGGSVASDAIPANGELRVDLLWQSQGAPRADYWTTVLLRGADGQVWSPAGTLRPSGYEPMPPTRSWQASQYAYDGHIVTPFAGSPPGTYDVVIAIFDRETLVPLSPLDAEGRALGTDLVFGSVRLLPPAEPLTREALSVEPHTQGTTCGPLALLESRLDRASAAPGDPLAVRWVWEAVSAPGTDYDAELVLEAPDGTVARAWTLPPSAPWWPTGSWSAGDRWVGRQVVRLPGDLDSGVHVLRVMMAGCDPLTEIELEVVAPPRTWTAPEGLTLDNIAFGGRIALIGHRLTPIAPDSGDVVEIELAWEALVPMEMSYRVYLHILDQEGGVIAQDDGEPAGWTRPTTGWAEGEIVRDLRRVELPALDSGTLTLRVGLYGPAGARLPTADGDDGVTLATFELD